MTDAIGWVSAVILLLTLSRQVYKQRQEGSIRGVSHWLFLGQVIASTGFTIYSFLLHNWVFVLTNAALLVVAIAGQWTYANNERAAARRSRRHWRRCAPMQVRAITALTSTAIQGR
jgi:MtN3 and saliva related transmembrane protein